MFHLIMGGRTINSDSTFMGSFMSGGVLVVLCDTTNFMTVSGFQKAAENPDI